MNRSFTSFRMTGFQFAVILNEVKDLYLCIREAFEAAFYVDPPSAAL